MTNVNVKTNVKTPLISNLTYCFIKDYGRSTDS